MEHDEPQIRWKVKLHPNIKPITTFAPALSHPLLPKTAYYQKPSTQDDGNSKGASNNFDFIDPLGVTLEEEVLAGPSSINVDIDILNDKESTKKYQILDNTLETKPVDRVIIDINLPDFEPWRTKRLEILNNYSTSEKLSITSSFLGAPKTVSSMSDKKKRRMEMLEDMSGLKKISELSQAEFVSHVNDLRELLVFAWDNNKRVEAIRIVTELARMLSSQVNAQFYPNQWVLVTDILDLFGKLVFTRLLSKANEERKAVGKSPLEQQFTSNDVPEKASEVAKNWFCKIADIKELIPRFYVETALISCLNFLDSSSCQVNLLRLCAMAGKFPQPLLGAYARAYVCKIAMYMKPGDRAIHWKALNDSMQQSSVYSPELTTPAYEWIIQCVSFKATTIDDLRPLWEYSKIKDKRFLVSAFLRSVCPRYVANHSLDFCELVFMETTSVTDICIFGERLLLTETPEGSRNEILKRVWRTMSNIPKFIDYLVVCSTWSKFIGRYFEFAELCILSAGVARRLQMEHRISDASLDLVVKIVCNIVGAKEYCTTLLKYESFQTILEYLKEEPFSSVCAQSILTEFVRSHTHCSVDDFVLANTILDQCRLLCEGVKPDTVDDEIRISSRLICCSLDRVALSSDYERGLSFLVQARGDLGELSDVIKHLLYMLTEFSFKCFYQMPNSVKKAAFLRACIANLYITIPSVTDHSARFMAIVRATYISLLANSIPQCYSLCNLALSAIASLETSTSINTYVGHFLSILVSVSDPANSNYLHFYDRLIEILQRKTFKELSSKCDMWILCLNYLCTVSQPDIPSKIPGVEGNDALYGSSPEYLKEVELKIAHAMNIMISLIEKEDSMKPLVSVNLLEFVVANFELDSMIIKMVLNLLKRVLKSGSYHQRVQYVIAQLKSVESNDSTLCNFLNKLCIQ